MMIIAQCDRTRLEFEPGAIEFLDIQEDIDGADIVTFECPICGEQHMSRVYG